MSVFRWGRCFPVVLVALGAGSCVPSNYTRLYHSQPHAPSYTPGEIASLQHMGSTFTDKGVNFAVYSAHAQKMRLLLFDSEDAHLPSRSYDMTRYGNVWNVYVEGVGDGQMYGYVAWGPNWTYDPDWYPGSILGFHSDVDAQGNRFDPNKLLLDPYARAISRDFDWSVGSPASGPDRTNPDYQAATKSIVVKSHYVWGPEEAQWRDHRQDHTWAGHRWNDMVIYEVHPKGFTASPASGVAHPGTYRGIGEKADYLKDLGITAVELMPVFEKPLDGGYWGYQTLGFFAPEISYSSRQGPGEPMDEFKWMVEELHKRGIEVILDVVFNHTGEGGLWRVRIQYGGASLDQAAEDPKYYSNLDPKQVAGLYEFRGLDNASYYALTPDGQYYLDQTGVGNDTRPNNAPFARLTIDSLRYWVQEMHVDGFRFDLAPILGLSREDNYGCWDDQTVKTTVLQAIIDDPVLQKYNTRIIAEPWMYGCYAQTMGGFPNSSNDVGDGWYEWDGPFRDLWREFVNQDGPLNRKEGPIDDYNHINRQEDVAGVLYGSEGLFGHNGRNPYNAVNFITIHDGFTMYDLFSYNQKQNGCSPLNPDCCQPVTPLCVDDGTNDNRSRNWDPPISQQDAVSCGADANCESTCDSKGTDRQNCIEYWCGASSACIADLHNQREAKKRQLMRVMFTAMMVSRGTPMLLGGDEWMRTQLGNNNAYSTRADNSYNWFDWGAWEPDPDRDRMHDFVRKVVAFRKAHEYAFAPMKYTDNPPQWLAPDGSSNVNWNGRSLMVHYQVSGEPELLILINMEGGTTDFTLPAGRSWKRLVDTQSWFDDPNTHDGVEDFFDQTKAPRNVSANITLDAPPPVTTPSYSVPSRNIVVLEADSKQ